MSHYTMLYKYGKRTREFLRRFYFYFSLFFYILGEFYSQTGCSLDENFANCQSNINVEAEVCKVPIKRTSGLTVNKTVIPLALVRYKTIIANSYQTRARRIIVKCVCSIYLSIAVFFVFGIVCTILTERQIILSHPLTSVMSSLSSELHHPCRATKVHLKPLKTVVMACAPGPHSRADAMQMKPAIVRCMVPVPAGRSGNLCRANAAVLHS